MDDGGEYLQVKLGDIIETTCFDSYMSEMPRVFMLVRDGKIYPGQVYWGQTFPLGAKEVVVSVRKCYARLLYSHEEV